MVDGTPSVLVSSSHTILDDSPLITRLTITLTNPQDMASIERLSLSTVNPLPPEIAAAVSTDGLTIELSGPASTDAYSQALSSVIYNYSKIANVIENQPNFTPRY